MSFIVTPSTPIMPTVPGGADTNVQFNSAGSFGGNANFTYNIATSAVGFGSYSATTYGVTFQTKAAIAAPDDTSLTFRTPSNAFAFAGPIRLLAGDGVLTSGGSVVLTGGASTISNGGGPVQITAGATNAAGIGGVVTLTGGAGNSGGGVTLVGGLGTSANGSILLSGTDAPSGTILGGSVICRVGQSVSGLQQSGFFTVEFGNGLNRAIRAFVQTGGGLRMGFYGATPIVRPTTADAAAAFVAGAGVAVQDVSTFDGYTLAQVVSALRRLGFLT